MSPSRLGFGQRNSALPYGPSPRAPDQDAAEVSIVAATVTGRLEDAKLPPSDLIFASYSLPFCPPGRFGPLWDRITGALRPGGLFAGELFGERDSWSGDPSMTFVSRSRMNELLSGLTVLSFEEEDAPGDSFAGPKHWHVFHVVVQRQP